MSGGGEATEREGDDDGVGSADTPTESKETATGQRQKTATDCDSTAMHTIEIVSRVAIKEDAQATISLSVKGGSGDFRWYPISSTTLPAGMYFTGEGKSDRTASIEGTPIQSGTFSPLIQVRDETCHRTAEKQISIEVAAAPKATPATPPATDLSGKMEKPAVRLIYDTLGSDPKEIFLYEDKPQDAPNFRNFIRLIVQPAGKTGDDQPIPADRYKIKYRYYHVFQKPDGSAGSDGCDPVIAISTPSCYLEVENGVVRDAKSIPGVDEFTEYEFIVNDTQADNKEYRYLVYGKKGCKTLNLNDTHLLFKLAYNKLSDSGYCYSGGDHHVTWAGAGLGNMQHHLTVTDNNDQWLRGGIYRNSYKLTSEANDNQITTNPKQIIWGPADRQVAAYSDHEARCLEDIDMFGLWFKEGGCAGTPDFRVSAIEVKACPNEQDLQREGGENCYYASYYKSGDYIGWNSVSNYGECMGNFNFDRIPGTNLETWSRDRDMQVVDVFNALGVLY